MKRVAVVGGGFAGVYAIKELQRETDVKILLFEPRKRFVFTPLLHEVAADVLHAPAVTYPYERIFHRRFRHIQQRVKKVDLKGRKLTTEDGKQHAYDYIILAPGAKTRMPAEAPGLLELKGVASALKIRRRIEQNILRAVSEKDPGLLTCVIVGGGPTGVELAAELVDFYKHRIATEDMDAQPMVMLLQSRETLLPQADKALQRTAHDRLTEKDVSIVYGCRVHKVHASGITAHVKGREQEIKAACIIWTAGITPNIVAAPGVPLERDKFPIADTLQVQGFTHAFAIGDASHLKDPLPALAQVAVQQGAHAGKNIRALLHGKAVTPFKYKGRGFLVSLGQKYGAGSIGRFRFSGLFAWVVWRTVYLVKFVGVRSKARMAAEYTIRLFGRK